VEGEEEVLGDGVRGGEVEVAGEEVLLVGEHGVVESLEGGDDAEGEGRWGVVYREAGLEVDVAGRQGGADGVADRDVHAVEECPCWAPVVPHVYAKVDGKPRHRVHGCLDMAALDL